METGDLILGPERVATIAILTPAQDQWFMPDEHPSTKTEKKGKNTLQTHITLLVEKSHNAKNLGPMIQRAREVPHWLQTDRPPATVEYGSHNVEDPELHPRTSD